VRRSLSTGIFTRHWCSACVDCLPRPLTCSMSHSFFVSQAAHRLHHFNTIVYAYSATGSCLFLRDTFRDICRELLFVPREQMKRIVMPTRVGAQPPAACYTILQSSQTMTIHSLVSVTLPQSAVCLQDSSLSTRVVQHPLCTPINSNAYKGACLCGNASSVAWLPAQP
jgi:hypothetical protein